MMMQLGEQENILEWIGKQGEHIRIGYSPVCCTFWIIVNGQVVEVNGKSDFLIGPVPQKLQAKAQQQGIVAIVGNVGLTAEGELWNISITMRKASSFAWMENNNKFHLSKFWMREAKQGMCYSPYQGRVR